jgi:hypothetical protein
MIQSHSSEYAYDHVSEANPRKRTHSLAAGCAENCASRLGHFDAACRVEFPTLPRTFVQAF